MPKRNEPANPIIDKYLLRGLAKTVRKLEGQAVAGRVHHVHLLESGQRYLPDYGKQDAYSNADTPFKKLLWACRYGELEVVRQILTEHPELVHYRENHLHNPLCQAAFYKKLPVVRALVDEFGANVNGPGTYENGTALHCACSGPGSLEVVDYLIRKGADVRARSNHDFQPTPLRTFLFFLPPICQTPDKLSILRLLVIHGALQGESLDPYSVKSLRDYMRWGLNNDKMAPFLVALGLDLDQGVDALFQALASMAAPEDPNMQAFLAAFGNITIEEEKPRLGN